MKKLRWQLIIILVTGLIVGVLLMIQQPDGQAAPSIEPTKGGTYTEGIVGSIKRLNPLLDSYNATDRDIDRLIFNGLIRFDARGLPQADLAESWGMSKDGTVYNFSLKPKLVWQDGQPVTTDDVVFTIDLLRSSSALVPADLNAFWKDVVVKRLDASTIQFRLPEAFAPFMDYLSFGVLPKHLLGSMTLDQIVDAPFNLKPVGTGPYKFDHLVVENNQIAGVALTLSDTYYGKKPFIQQIVFRTYPDSQTIYQAYQHEEIQGIGQVTPDILPQVLANPNLALYTGRQPDLTLVLFNLNNPDAAFLQDAQVRQALYLGLNRQRIVDKVLHGQAILANGPLFPDTWAYADGLEPVVYDSAAALQMLKDDGYAFPAEGDHVLVKDDQKLSLQLIYPESDQYQAEAESIQNDWQALGLKVDLEAVSYDQLISDRLDSHQYQVALVDLNLARTPDPDPYPFWDQAQITGGQNYTQWDNRAASEYIEQARITADIAERTLYYRNFQVIFMRDLPALPLFYPVYTYAVDRQVQSVQMGPLFETSDRFANIQDWFLVSVQKGQASATPGTKPTNP
ncbi:MAG: peptide ABC transporter substrate-binding protein [Chloroflexi bacterium]|nr:peptide ABC transporter substrate-binding protein [Chloroflexota bacterium]